MRKISPTASALVVRLQRVLRPIDGAAEAQAASRQSRRQEEMWHTHVASTEVRQLQQRTRSTGKCGAIAAWRFHETEPADT